MRQFQMPLFLFIICIGFFCMGAKHVRDGSHLPSREKKFAEQLTIKKRRIFCGQFNHKQRQAAIKYARGRGKDSCFTPDEAVVKVMEETGMSLAVKGRKEIEAH